MNSKLKKSGFSLTEVLIAVGTLALGMALIAGVFPVAVHFTTQTIERTTAAVVADEAFAKIQLYGVDFNSPPWLSTSTLTCYNFNGVSLYRPILPQYLVYPSTNFTTSQQYSWSAICRRIDLQSSCVQVTVFVCRMSGAAATYWKKNPLNDSVSSAGSIPDPVRISVTRTPAADELLILNVPAQPGVIRQNFINDGYTIVDNETGRIYRVLQRYPDRPTFIQLDRPWVPGGNKPPSVWVIPPPVNGGRSPCVGVFQKVISF